jgi:hypothetical protein
MQQSNYVLMHRYADLAIVTSPEKREQRILWLKMARPIMDAFGREQSLSGRKCVVISCERHSKMPVKSSLLKQPLPMDSTI